MGYLEMRYIYRSGVLGTPQPGASIYVYPADTPLLAQEQDGSWSPHASAGEAFPTDATGQVDFKMPWAATSRPTTARFVIAHPDGDAYIGQVPSFAGPFDLEVLLDNWNWVPLPKPNPPIQTVQGAPGVNWKNTPWAATTTYGLNDALTYNGSSYRNILPIAGSVQNTNPASDTTHWTLLAAQGTQGPQGNQGNQGNQGVQGTPNWKGAWSGATAYIVGDAVGDIGSSYVCILPHTNHEPPNATYWSVLAQKGDTGATGLTGNTGATGSTGATGATGPAGPNPTYDTLANRPAANTQADKTLFVATDQNGETAYQVQSGVWVQITRGVTALPPTHGSTHSPLGADPMYHLYGHAATDALDNIYPLLATASVTLSNGQVFLGFFRPWATLTVSSLLILGSTTLSSTATMARMGVFTVDGSFNVTLVARTANVASSGAKNETTGATNVGLLQVASDLYSAPFDATGGFPTTYQLVQGTLYGFGIIMTGQTSVATVRGLVPPGGILQLSPLKSVQFAGTGSPADLPTAQTATSSTSASSFVLMRAK